MVQFLYALKSDCWFTLPTSNGCISRARSLKNDVLQGSIISLLVFNIHISNLPHTQSKQNGYADVLALLDSDKSWSKIAHKLKLDIKKIFFTLIGGD